MALGVALAAAGLIGLPGTALAAPMAPSGEGALTIEVEATAAPPVPGASAVHTVRVTNAGTGALTGVVVQLDGRAGCRWALPLLPAADEVSLTCAAVVETGAAVVLRARARARAGVGRVVQATAAVRLEIAVPAPPPPPPPAPPPAPRRAPAGPPPAAPPPLLAATPAAPVAPAAVAAPRVSTPAAVLGGDIPPTVRTVARTGPLASPARAAGLVAIISVMIMTATVGALAAAVRVR